jgi:DNA-binding transcriptional MerR regulator/methylmalonyl-CoA mutase cobalamin-binding subunit
MFTIKQAAARSGLTVPTVRAWERRYGVVHPERTASGYRLYDDAAIGRLIAMRHLVERHGFRPSQAADQVLAGGAELAALLDRAAAESETEVVSRTGASPANRSAELVDAFVTAAQALDVGGMDRALDEAFAAQRFEAALEDVLFPALRRVGEGWSEGSLDVSMEHAASESIRRRLVRFYESVASAAAPQVIVGLPPGSHHEIGALAFAIAARRGGLETIYLGADVPLESWLVAAETTRAPVAVLGVIDASDVPAATEVVAALRTSPGRTTVALGGRRAHEVGGTGSIVLSGSIDDAVRAVRELVVSR